MQKSSSQKSAPSTSREILFPLAIIVGVCIAVVSGWLLNSAPGVVHIASGVVSGVVGFLIADHIVHKRGSQ